MDSDVCEIININKALKAPDNINPNRVVSLSNKSNDDSNDMHIGNYQNSITQILTNEK